MRRAAFLPGMALAFSPYYYSLGALYLGRCPKLV